MNVFISSKQFFQTFEIELKGGRHTIPQFQTWIIIIYIETETKKHISVMMAAENEVASLFISHG